MKQKANKMRGVLAGMVALLLAFGLILTGCPTDGGGGGGDDDSFTAQTDSSTANDEETLGLVGTGVSSSDSSVATAAITDGKIGITSVAPGTLPQPFR
jgi:hypothetical protein